MKESKFCGPSLSFKKQLKFFPPSNSSLMLVCFALSVRNQKKKLEDKKKNHQDKKTRECCKLKKKKLLSGVPLYSGSVSASLNFITFGGGTPS